MLETLLVAAAILLVMDVSVWRYGRDFIKLNRTREPNFTYGSFLARRIPIIIAVFGALALVMMESRKSIYLRVALLVVMLVGYIVITLRDLKGDDVDT